MRKRYAILIICLSGILFPFRSFAQDEVFPTKDAIWSIHMYDAFSGFRFVYGLIGDTVVNGQIYNKLYLLNDTLLQIDSKDIYVGGIRQFGKKVYMKPADKSTGEVFEEFLMYDFSVKAGDRVNLGKYPMMGWDYYEPTFENVRIEDIGDWSIFVNEIFDSKYGRAYYMENDNIWIEGIGSLSGLFFLPIRYTTCCVDSYSGCELACLKVKDEVLYLKDECKECFEMPVYMGLEKKHLFPLKIQYNLEGKNIRLQVDVENLPLQFELLSLSGQIIQSQIIREAESRIELRATPGVYIYRIIGDKVYKSDKIVVR